MNANEPQNCTLRLAAENVAEWCSRERCAFWEPGGAVIHAGCVIERLGVEVRRDDVAAFLLGLRRELEREYRVEEVDAQLAFARRLGPE
jgi:hypothetical protein